MQRMKNPDQSTWRCNIVNNRVVVAAEPGRTSSVLLKLGRTDVPSLEGPEGKGEVFQEMEADYVFAATGYRRNAHEDMLDSVRSLVVDERGSMKVRRDYGVQFLDGKVDTDAGVWLQGCNEKTHGVSYSCSFRGLCGTDFILVERYPTLNSCRSWRRACREHFQHFCLNVGVSTLSLPLS
jgi:L-ornithine N5-oxygenase